MVNVKTISTIGKIGAGVAVAGILYDSHRHAKIRSAAYTEKKEGEAIMKSFRDSQVLDSPSKIKFDYKNWLRDFRCKNGARPFANATIGYFKGFGEMLTHTAVPAALATATLLLPKGWGSVISAAGLAVYGTYDFLKTTFNIGVNKRYTTYF